MNEIFIEAESFTHKGGWVVDQQSMEDLHSSYLMAHGLGIPVENARTQITVADAGEYYLWALTRDWTAVWNVLDSAGKFRLLVDGKCYTPTPLGTNGSAWGWQSAGQVYLEAGTHTLELEDLTGFNGRCDAVYLTDSPEKPSDDRDAIDELRKRLNWKEIEDCEESYDLIVVGGGVAGTCLALSAKRLHIHTLLLQDRGVLGGCNSSEIRVNMGGEIHIGPYPAIGNIVKEIAPVMGDPRIFEAEYYEDHRKKAAFELLEHRYPYKILYNMCVTDVEMQDGKITAVIATHTETGRKTRFHAPLFADCSGDGIVARLSGCKTMYGREARSEFDETLAPEEHQNLVMGQSIRWYTEDTGAESPFPKLDWNLPLDDASCLHVISGDWEQETGFTRDMIHETEYIRDYGLRAIFANWSFQKHSASDRETYRNLKLKWVSALGGKRESCRVYGEHVLTQRDIEEHIPYEDATAAMSWSIDMHFPEPDNEAAFGEAFRSYAYHRGIVEPYPVPYRCLYARDVPNLFLGGRIVSTTHVAFSSIRVMRTLGQLGEVAAMAAAVCTKHSCLPHDVYTTYLDELKEHMRTGIVSPDAFGCGVDASESYHFKDIGWLRLHPYSCDTPSRLDKFKRGIAKLGIRHKYPLPDELK